MTRERSPLVRRRRGVAGVAVLCLSLTVAAFVVGRQVKSPAQRAAETVPPPVTTLTVEVEHRVLRDTVVLAGRVEPARRIDVAPTSAHGADRLVVTGVRVRPGDQVKAGEVLAVISGRPVIVLLGKVPAYRDLQPGATGADVTQLQRALRTAGAHIGDHDGMYGDDTKAAVADLYADAGFVAPQAVVDAEDNLAAVQRRTADATEALAASTERAKREQAALQRELAEAQTALNQVDGEDPVALAAAQRRVADATEALAASTERAKREQAALQRELADAVNARERLRGRVGAMLPLNEVVFVPRLPAQIIEVKAVVGEPPENPMIVIAGGELVARGYLPRADRAAVTEDLEVLLSSSAGELTGVLETIDEPTDDEMKAHPITVAAKLPRNWLGLQLRMSIVVAETAQGVLVVPVAAVFAGADTQTSVTRLRDGVREKVPVTVGASGDGYVEVRSAALAPGDRVVVGERGGFG